MNVIFARPIAVDLVSALGLLLGLGPRVWVRIRVCVKVRVRVIRM